jgi:hypothetical protein
MKVYDAIGGELLVHVIRSHHPQSVYTGIGRLRARRDSPPGPMVGVDEGGERRELRQVVQLSDAFRGRHQVTSGLLLHTLASLLEFPDRSLAVPRPVTSRGAAYPLFLAQRYTVVFLHTRPARPTRTPSISLHQDGHEYSARQRKMRSRFASSPDVFVRQ